MRPFTGKLQVHVVGTLFLVFYNLCFNVSTSLCLYPNYLCLFALLLDPFKNVRISGACRGKNEHGKRALFISNNSKLHWEPNLELTSIDKPNNLNTTHFRLLTDEYVNRIVPLVRNGII